MQKDQTQNFQPFQRWENPDGLRMTITAVKNGLIYYTTDEGQRGYQVTKRFDDWLGSEAITLVDQRPILFNAPMVREILADLKTQTRRCVSPLPSVDEHGIFTWEKNKQYACISTKGEPVCGMAQHSPYGKIGDELWVRERMIVDQSHGSVELAKYFADGGQVLHAGPEEDANGEDDYGGTCVHWMYSRPSCPSIHMKREFSRIQLLIKGIRIERLQDISESDARAEGVKFDQGWEEPPGYGFLDYSKENDERFAFTDPRDSFRTLWQKLNTKPGTTWDDNPFVWVIQFRKIKP